MTVISLDSIIYLLTYLLTAIGPWCCRPNALSYPHATKSSNQMRVMGSMRGRYAYITAAYVAIVYSISLLAVGLH